MENETKMSFVDVMKRELQKQRARARLGFNKMRGKMGEDTYKMQSQMSGKEVQRTGRGSDFRERKVDLLTGKKGPWKLVEVKSSATAPVSPLQRKGIRSGKVKVVRPQLFGFGF